MRSRRWLAAAAGMVMMALAAVPTPLASRASVPADTLPARLSDQAFWKLSAELSEPNGYFRSENLVSNEHTYQYVIPALTEFVKPGGVYLGVAPDQNFTYMIAARPKMAFIVDIRRGNLLQHLMYKAIFELSPDRAEFVSRLFSKTRPAGLTAKSTVAEIFTAFARVRMTDADYQKRYEDNLRTIREHLTKKHGFTLSAADLEQLAAIYYAFFWEGPGIRYTTSPGGFSSRGGGGNFPSYEEMLLQTDWEGNARSYLASEENYQFVKSLEERNLIVPVVGNFAGNKALRAVGQYIREHGATVSAFYLSNVEQYLQQDGIWGNFCANVASMPLDASSTFIRSSRGGGYGGGGGGLVNSLGPMLAETKGCGR